MRSDQITVNSRNFDGSIRRTWQCKLIERNEPLLIFVGIFDRDIEHADLGLIKKGTISYEYYWLDRWYNIFRFHERDGTFRNYYCNINMPPSFADGVLDYVDLDIDLVVWPDGTYKELDRDEYEANAAKNHFPPDLREQVNESLEELHRMFKIHKLPFDALYLASK